jgi:hypothetical protein
MCNMFYHEITPLHLTYILYLFTRSLLAVGNKLNSSHTTSADLDLCRRIMLTAVCYSVSIIIFHLNEEYLCGEGLDSTNVFVRYMLICKLYLLGQYVSFTSFAKM